MEGKKGIRQRINDFELYLGSFFDVMRYAHPSASLRMALSVTLFCIMLVVMTSGGINGKLVKDYDMVIIEKNLFSSIKTRRPTRLMTLSKPLLSALKIRCLSPPIGGQS